MTGIERLEGISMAFRGYTWGASLSEALSDIAGQIAREHAEDCFRMGERAADGKFGPKTRHEAALALLDDWEREAIERERDRRLGIAADVSMSAYDLLPQEERDAIAWVREHGGLEEVKSHWTGRVPLSNVKRMVELHKARRDRLKAHASFLELKCRERQARIVELSKLKCAYVDALNGVCKRLGLTDGTGLPDMPEVIWTELDRRLMPEGMEWPRYEDGEPVRIGDKFSINIGDKDEAVVVESIDFYDEKTCVCYPIGYTILRPGERVKRPTKVLDADGVEIRVDDEVFNVQTGNHHVTCVDTAGKLFRSMEQMDGDSTWLDPMCFTHRAPVLAADGLPLRKGETVYEVDEGIKHVVDHIEYEGGGTPNVYFMDGKWAYPALLTHERPDSLDRLAEDIGAMATAWRANRDLFDAQEAAAGCVGENTMGAALDSLVRRARALAGGA